MKRKNKELRVVRLPFWSRWEMRPQDEGQIVESCWCTDGDYLYERIFDRSDRSLSFWRKQLSAKVDLESDMDVPNGRLPSTKGKWEEIIAVKDTNKSY